jgi:hypothetical protein
MGENRVGSLHPPFGGDYEVSSRAGPEIVLPFSFISFGNHQLSDHFSIAE